MITLRNTWDDYIATQDLQPRTIYDHDNKLKRCVGDWLDVDMNTITKNMVQLRHRQLSTRPVMANSAMRIVRTLFNYAINRYEDEQEEPLIKRNPVKRLSATKSWNKEKPRSRHIPFSRLKDWMDAVLTLPSLTMSDYLVMLLLTGLRRSEGAGLLWENIDFQNKTLLVPITKNGEPHELPLTPLIEGILIGRRQADPYGRYVFASSRKDKGCISAPDKAIAIVVDKIGIKFSPHDLRRTFQMLAEDVGIEECWRKRLMNHTQSDVTNKHYSIKNIEKLREPMLKISERVQSLCELTP